MELPDTLKSRVYTALKRKLLASGMSGDSNAQALVETSTMHRIAEIERMLDEGSDLCEMVEFTPKGLAELEREVMLLEVNDPELAATIKAVRKGTLDVKQMGADIMHEFEVDFRGFCSGHGVTSRTVELLLAYRQAEATPQT
ncbi:MAG: hypothetical protein RLZZ360_540 [Candidatus Parcubacteria bacterium]|jgi:hypothetical protein